ncbi:MAG: zinc ribbon domain-containing protein [Methanomassiliicoccales archaeon]|nr:zinc ribbon domain-containing protein [Methanomassiliicoccales archaeon]
MTIYCPHCGIVLPDDALFCLKYGTKIISDKAKPAEASTSSVIAPSEALALKCPNCSAPIAPKFGEMVITCLYCGSTITLVNDGWRSVQKQTMLSIRFSEKEQIIEKIHALMDKGLLHRHLQEDSKLEDMSLSMIPYWIVSTSARTSIVASDMAAEAGQIATTMALAGLMGAALGGGRGRGGFGGPLLTGAVLGSTMGRGIGNVTKTQEIDNNYNFPIVALKAFTQYQPKDYSFALEERTFFDMAQVPKGIQIMNGDIGEEVARHQAKTLVDQLQSDKAHAHYHMIQQLHTQVDVSETELLHAPIWFARYDHEGNKIILVVDGNSGGVINSIGLG